MLKKLFTSTLVFALILTTFCITAFASDYYTDYTTLKYSTTSAQVTNLQNDLKKLGYFSGTSTGYFGTVTKASVISYQKAKSITADGVVGHGTARAIKVDRVIQTAKSLQGVPYVWGGTTSSGFDCSGFTQYVMAQNRMSILRTAALQYTNGSSVSKSSLTRGDFVFFETYKSGASHVGIYIGNDQFISAQSGAGKVMVGSLSSSYWSGAYVSARRLTN